MKRAEAMQPDYFEAMSYRSLLLGEQALLEKDPESQKKLTAEADAVRARAVEIIKNRRKMSYTFFDSNSLHRA